LAAAENCSLEDIQHHLYVLDKVRHGLEDEKQQGRLSQDDQEKRLSQWLSE
jgi:toxin ParE1/3/4